MAEIRLPDLGDVDAVRVVQWLVEVGDRVNEGDELVEVETDKAIFVVEAERTGRLAEITASPDARVAVGGLLGRIEADDG
jgi:pyruvate/2-oxoglutarate dehydrogenase complex dihydrolipoamide acyltransferase (E2) component